jgi:hypothetical protein
MFSKYIRTSIARLWHMISRSRLRRRRKVLRPSMIKAKWIGKGEGKVEVKKETGTGEGDAEGGVWKR